MRVGRLGHPEDTSMPDANHCPNCGATRPADAPEGLCPRCLMRNALGGETTVPPDASNAPTDHGTDATGGWISDPAATARSGQDPGSSFRMAPGSTVR